MGEAIGALMEQCKGVLLGRVTYEMFEPVWSKRTVEEDPGAPFFKETMKYIVSSTLSEATWSNSTVVGPYDAGAIGRLKDEVNGDLYVSGSGTLVGPLRQQCLLRRRCADRVPRDRHPGRERRARLRLGAAAQRSRIVRSSRLSRSGSARMSISTIVPPRTVKPATENGRPSRTLTVPAVPLISAGCTYRSSCEKDIAARATASAPRTTRDIPAGGAPASARTTTSGSSTRRSASKSPARAAATKPSTRARWLARSASGGGAAPRTRRRARLASCLVAADERPTIGAISSKGTANMSCRTKASRSAGVSVSSTTSSARPTESASNAS